MYAGRIVEEGSIDDIFEKPSHPYTIGLLASLPTIESQRRRLYSIRGQPPNMAYLPSGCSFRTRCPIGSDRPECAAERPGLLPVDGQHRAACFFKDEAVEWAQQALFGDRPLPEDDEA